MQSTEKEPIHIMNVGVLMSGDLSDSEASRKFADFCAQNTESFKLVGIRRITFVVFYNRQFPRYFTYRWAALLLNYS